jgi:hypothetical protein
MLTAVVAGKAVVNMEVCKFTCRVDGVIMLTMR